MKYPKSSAFIITIPVALIIGTPMWLIWTYAPPLFPFLIVWLVIHPIYKLWRELDL